MISAPLIPAKAGIQERSKIGSYCLAKTGSPRQRRRAAERRRTHDLVQQLCIAVAALLYALLAAAPAHATAEYDYKTNERLVIDGGLAPNKKLAISAGLAGGKGPFFFLTSEPSHRVVTQLRGGIEIRLDTAPNALHAIWAPDSKHVAIICRTDRHELAMWLFAVDSRHAEIIAGPDVLDVLLRGKGLTMDDYSIRLHTVEITWQDARRFHLSQQWLFNSPDRKLAQALGPYGAESPNDTYKSTEDGKPVTWTFVDIAADADCELAPGNRYRVIATKPGEFAKRE